MATSGSTDYSTDRDTIIKDAMIEIGALNSGDSPTADEITDCSRFLNGMVKHWQIHIDLWPTKDVPHTLTPGTESYTVGDGADIDTPRPLRLISCRREDSSGNEIKVEVVTREEYKNLPTKSTQATVNVVYYDPQLSEGVLYVWPTGTTTDKILNLTFQRPLEDFDAAIDEPDFPQEWYLALVKNLAVNISPMFEKPIDPFLQATADRLLEELKGFDTEAGSIYMQPETE